MWSPRYGAVAPFRGHQHCQFIFLQCWYPSYGAIAPYLGSQSIQSTFLHQIKYYNSANKKSSVKINKILLTKL